MPSKDVARWERLIREYITIVVFYRASIIGVVIHSSCRRPDDVWDYPATW